MISALGEIADAVTALKSGADDYLIKPFDPTELLLQVRGRRGAPQREDLIEAGARTAAGGARLVGEGRRGARPAALDRARSPPRATTVLITGESGTGKEVVAREIHACSPRGRSPSWRSTSAGSTRA